MGVDLDAGWGVVDEIPAGMIGVIVDDEVGFETSAFIRVRNNVTLVIGTIVAVSVVLGREGCC